MDYTIKAWFSEFYTIYVREGESEVMFLLMYVKYPSTLNPNILEVSSHLKMANLDVNSM